MNIKWASWFHTDIPVVSEIKEFQVMDDDDALDIIFQTA